MARSLSRESDNSESRRPGRRPVSLHDSSLEYRIPRASFTPTSRPQSVIEKTFEKKRGPIHIDGKSVSALGYLTSSSEDNSGE